MNDTWVCKSCGWVNVYFKLICKHCKSRKSNPITNVAEIVKKEELTDTLMEALRYYNSDKERS